MSQSEGEGDNSSCHLTGDEDSLFPLIDDVFSRLLPLSLPPLPQLPSASCWPPFPVCLSNSFRRDSLCRFSEGFPYEALERSKSMNFKSCSRYSCCRSDVPTTAADAATAGGAIASETSSAT